MTQLHKVAVAKGDGIGPEIMDATLDILHAAGAPIDPTFIQIGQSVYEQGISSGIPDEAWSAIESSDALLKAPITTPQGKGFKSVNVTLRKTLNMFANVRPCKSYSPFVASQHPDMNLVIIRENEEDLYAGIEHRQTPEVTQVLKLITRPGSENIIRYAFEYAKAYGRKKVTCMSKDNIMKLTDGLFRKVFEEISEEYPDIQADHQIIDIGSAKLATRPEDYDVIVSLNLYGDIISDIAAEIAGSVGLASSANVGFSTSMFEAIHGSAPDIAGKNIANPSGLLIAAVQMLVHLGEGQIAEQIQNAWLKTLEDGVHTGDIYQSGLSKAQVGTKEFAQAVIERLGEVPSQLNAVKFDAEAIKVVRKPSVPTVKTLVGVDAFLCWDEPGRDPNVLGAQLEAACPEGLNLSLVTNRGVKVYPQGRKETFCTDHWRCRFRTLDNSEIAYEKVIELMQSLTSHGLEVIKTENLCLFDGEYGFSLGQGE